MGFCSFFVVCSSLVYSRFLRFEKWFGANSSFYTSFIYSGFFSWNSCWFCFLSSSSFPSSWICVFSLTFSSSSSCLTFLPMSFFLNETSIFLFFFCILSSSLSSGFSLSLLSGVLLSLLLRFEKKFGAKNVFCVVHRNSHRLFLHDLRTEHMGIWVSY